MSAEPTPQVTLAAVLDEISTRVAVGDFGDVTDCVVVLKGQTGYVVLTYPILTLEQLLDELQRTQRETMRVLPTTALPN